MKNKFIQPSMKVSCFDVNILTIPSDYVTGTIAENASMQNFENGLQTSTATAVGGITKVEAELYNLW